MIRQSYYRREVKSTVPGTEELYESHLKAQRQVIWKGSVARFSLHAAEESAKLAQELAAGTYIPKPPVLFTIYRPKRREILAVAYRDRVYQRWINDKLLYPVMTRSFVKENAACQIGKGTKYCMDLFRKNLRRFYINHGLNGWFLQIDIEHYYPSMRHDKAKEMFRRRLDDETYRMVAEVLDGQYEGDVGYNPGSQMVQIAGISFLDGIDHFIKEKLKIKDYVRIMDDMVLIHEDREYLESCLKEIRKELGMIGLKCHPKKTKIIPIREGITFMGFRWALTGTGKVILIPKSETVKNLRRSMERLMKLYARGERSRKCVDDSMQSRLAHLEKGNTWKLRRRLIKWYNERIKHYEKILQSQRHEPSGKGKARKGHGGYCSRAGRRRRCTVRTDRTGGDDH